MKRVLFSVGIFFSFWVNGQSLRNPVATSYIGSGGYSKTFADPFSFTSNSAALAFIHSASAGVYSEKRFMFNSLDLFTVVLALPSSKGNFGMEANYFGFKNYNESSLGIAYGRSLGEKISIGARFNYFSLRIPGYVSASAIDFDVGFIASINSNFGIGFSASNPVGGRFLKSMDEKLRSEYKFGAGFTASEVFYISGEIIKEEDMTVDVNAGIQYQYSKRFFIRAGMRTATSIGYAGAGCSWNNFRLDVCASYHPMLGLSPGIMLVIKFRNNE